MEINSLWIGKELSQLEIMCIQSHINVGHKYNLWCYQELNVPNGTIVKDANDIVPKSNIFCYQSGAGKGSYSAVSNVFRYKLLLEIGGWWCDTDVAALKPFDFDEDYVFATERTQSGCSTPTTCVIKCPANSDIMKFCYSTSVSVDTSKLVWGQIGPSLLNSAIIKHNMSDKLKPCEYFCPTDWFEAKLDPAIHRAVDLSQSYAVHFWHEMWRQSSLNKNDTFDSTSLYGRLLNDILRK